MRGKKVKVVGITFCNECEYRNGELCHATAKNNGIDYVTGKEKFRGQRYCSDRNKIGRCQYFKKGKINII